MINILLKILQKLWKILIIYVICTCAVQYSYNLHCENFFNFILTVIEKNIIQCQFKLYFIHYEWSQTASVGVRTLYNMCSL